MNHETVRRLLTGFLLTTVSVITLAGCGVANAADTQPMPKPVTENGMTLDWGPDVKAQALKMIDNAHTRLYLDIYELSDPDILQALAAARARGVDTRVIVDATEKHSQGVAIPALAHDGVPAESLTIPHGISHIKLLIADDSALIGGMNFGAQSWSNNDASVFLPVANQSFLALFRWDWARAAGQPAAAPEYLLPLIDDRAAQQVVVQDITGATKTVSMEAFDLSDWGVLTALEAAARRGVQVQVLLDRSQHLNRETATELRAAGADVRFYQPYGGELMHAKILDVDGGRVFFIGSANFSHQAYAYNHEGDIQLTNMPLFDASLRQDLRRQMARGTDSAGSGGLSGSYGGSYGG